MSARACEKCGSRFDVSPKSPNQRFCGLGCSNSRQRQRAPEEQRFWVKVERSNDGCWRWTGARTSSGYGQFTLAGRRRVVAHRWAWEQVNGPVPAGLWLDHLCRNRECVRPAHLEPVTHAENVQRGLKGDLRPPNQLRSHCANGHAMTPENVALRTERARPQWRCRRCAADRSARRMARTQGRAA